MSRSPGAVALLLAATLVVLAATPAAAAPGLGATSVSPSSASTGATTTLDLSVNATAVNGSDGTTGANVTVAVPAALDLSGATATGSVAPNATGVTAAVDAGANAVVVSWDDAGGADAETLAVTATVSGVAVERTGDHDLTATVDADGDGATDASGSVGTVAATAPDADRSVADPQSVLFLGEEAVDLTGVDGVAPAGASQRFHGVGGDAEGVPATAADAAAVDVTRGQGFTTGTYALVAGGESTLVVQEPTVTDLDLYPGTSTGGTDVSGSSIPASVETLTVEPRFDFAASENATVVVESAGDLNVTGELVEYPTVSSSGETVHLDVTDLAVGTYTVRVEGVDDLDDANATATVRVRESARTVTLSRTHVARGEATVATVSGRPGAVRHVRLSADALADGERVTVPTAKAVFGASDGLVLEGANAGADVLYAVVALDDDGFARVELQTDRLETGTHEVVVARNATVDAESSIPLTLSRREITATAAPSTVGVGESVNVSGRAVGADAVKLYATVGGAYAPLSDEDGDLAEPDVDDDGEWSVEVDTAGVLSVTGDYRIVAVADPDDDYLGSAARIDEATRRGFETTATASLLTTAPAPTASLSQSRIATGVGDEVRVTGEAPGPGERVRGYVVSPRGDLTALDVTVPEDDAFDFEVDAFETAGRYRVLVVAPGRDATFGYADGGAAGSVRAELDGSETGAEVRGVLREAYGGAGVDDRIVELTVTANAPRVAVETVTIRDGRLRVAGRTNREAGAFVGLELRRAASVVAVGTAEANASGRFRTAMDAAGLADGRYVLRVETTEASDVRTVRLGSASTPTPATTGGGTDTPGDAAQSGAPTGATQSADATGATGTGDAGAPGTAAAEGATPAATDRATRTGATGDGFGALAALLSLAVAALAVARGRR